MNDILQLRNDYFLKSYVQQEVEMTYIVIEVLCKKPNNNEK